MKRGIAHTFGVASMVLASLPLAAWQSTRTPFHANSAAVLVDVVVRDKQHRPVVDLVQSDFELFEDGTPQDVAYFALIAPATAHPADPTRPKSEASGALTSLDGPHEPAKIVLAFEQLSPEGRQLAAAASRQFLNEGLRPGDVASVVAIDRALHVLVSYTEDRTALDRGIDQASRRAGHPWEVAGGIPGAEWGAGQTASNATATDSPYVRMHLTLDALTRLLETMHGMEGRRVIVLFSEGFALGQSREVSSNPNVSPHDREAGLYDNRWDALNSLVKQANRDGISFYTFDARGLRVAGNTPGMGEAAYIGLKFLADETGGAFVEATNDLANGVRRVAADLQAYYLLGYTSSRAPDHRFRQLKVKVKRRGVTVLARRGYVADGSRH